MASDDSKSDNQFSLTKQKINKIQFGGSTTSTETVKIRPREMGEVPLKKTVNNISNSFIY